MTAKESFWTVLLSIATFTFIGGASGLIVSVVAPNYYDSVFYPKQSDRIDPFIGGIRLGASQGVVVGIVIALVVLAVSAFRESHAYYAKIANQSSHDSQHRRSWTAILFWISSTLILVTIFSTISFILGAVIEDQRHINYRTTQKIEKLETILRTDAYPDLKITVSSAAQVFLVGTVPDQDTRTTLFQQVVTGFGTEEAENIFYLVDVQEPPD